MKRLLTTLALLAVSFAPSAQADEFMARSLKEVAICLGENQAGVSDSAASFLPSLERELETLVTTQLTAYRVYQPCMTSDKRAYMLVSVTLTEPLGGTYRAYTVYLEAYSVNVAAYNNGVVTLWSDFTTAVNNQSASVLNTSLKSAIRSLLDKFAADYALANP